METQKVFEKIDEIFEEYIGVWEDICNIESPTSLKVGVDRVGEYIIRHAEHFGWSVEVNRQEVSGNAICITMNSDAKKAPICLSGHMDTVHPVGLFGSPAVRIDRAEGKIYGPGVVDCKGGIASSLLCMAALHGCGYTERPVKLILQSDEEVSSVTSGKSTVRFMADCAKGCVAFLNCEGHSRGKLIVERKGIIRFILDITGRAAHSSQCYNGRSAIVEAAHKIIELEQGGGAEWKDKDGITCNCGVISGGTVANTVPEKCSILIDFRYKTASQRERIMKRITEIAEKSYVDGTTCTLTLKSERVSMEKCEVNDALFERIREIFDSNGLVPVERGESTGGSDAADMTSYGIPTVDNFGTSGGNIHSKDEWAYLDSLGHSARMLASVICEI